GGGVADPLRMNGSEIIRAVRDAGIVGLGGAEFPTHVKLLPPPGKTLDCLIINGVECEPYLTADHRLMLERTGDLLGGIRLFMRAAGVGCALVGIEENKRDACDALRRMIGEAGDVVPVLLEVKYPQGAEKQLIKALTGREVPRRGLPADVGVIVQNVGTAVAAWEACRLGKPLYERVVTVSGPAVREAGNLMVRIGTLFKEVIAQCGGLTGDAGLLIMGGPMMGVAQWSMDVPVVKGTSGIVAMPAGMARKGEEACIRCGRCLEVCPMGLSPALIRQAVEKGRWDLAAEHGVEECIECGACVYVCATDRNQIQLYKRAKLEIRKGKTDAGRAA
ncbi:MAG: RnfABCDGE type electron transport complex subunit C, partial [Candidatus Aureabacteria bacterium]|nr:RnfABCDGE type electron transport complex subunit C [Candidatus Auribacterota bacterium]